ncbi:DNA sulfur modification protein DndB [Aliivibrio fischeri]|uniref:DNA sulfur modification protein DndB n=1 Tax=Aliivibrio fischeri TaxID=668 RepID=UPI0007C59018|nr:DNA sulfur modification protein DndB [Aliivibrio fischeri]
MNAVQQLSFSKHKIVANDDLALFAIKGTEGIGSTFLTKLSYQQCCDFLQIESEEIEELERLQRSADSSRVNGIRDYLVNRDNTVFPSLCLIVGAPADIKEIDGMASTNGTSLVNINIPKNSDRLLIDGQGRRKGIELALAIKSHLSGHHIDVKIVFVPTELIKESEKLVKQIFTDYHYALKKPTPSQSIYFDSEQIINNFAKELIKITDARGVPFSAAVATQRLKCGQIFTLTNVVDFICIFMGVTKTEVNKILSNSEKYDFYLLQLSRYIEILYQHLPFEKFQNMQQKEWKRHTSEHVACCAIGLKALGYIGNSLLEDAAFTTDTQLAEFNEDALKGLSKLPLDERKNPLWLRSEIYQSIEGKIKIIKSSERRLARVICSELRIQPSKTTIR